MSGHIVLAQALHEAGEAAEASHVFTAALELDPENLIALRTMGDIARGNGAMGTARHWYERLLEADPRNDQIAGILSELPSAAGEPVTAAAAEAEVQTLSLDMRAANPQESTDEAEAPASAGALAPAPTAFADGLTATNLSIAASGDETPESVDFDAVGAADVAPSPPPPSNEVELGDVGVLPVSEPAEDQSEPAAEPAELSAPEDVPPNEIEISAAAAEDTAPAPR